jgi:hypothetical protein
MIVSYPDSKEDEKDIPLNDHISAPLSKCFIRPLGKVVQNEVEGEWDTQNPGGHSTDKFWSKTSGDYLEEASGQLPGSHECELVAGGLTLLLQNDGTDNPMIMNVEEALRSDHVIPIALASEQDERCASEF